MMKKISVIAVLLFLVTGQPVSGLEITKKLLIVNNLAESLSSVNLATGAVTHTESNVYGLAPNAVTVHNGKGYIINSLSHDISVISLSDYSVTGTIALPEGSNPWSMVFTGLNTAYVSSYAYGRVYVVDVSAGAVTDSIAVGIAPGEMLRLGSRVYVINSGFNLSDYSYAQGTVSVLNTELHEETVRLSVPLNPQSLAMAPDGMIYVLTTGDYFSHFGKLAVINPSGGEGGIPAVTDSMIIGGTPSDIKFTSAGLGFIAAGGEWLGGGKGYVYLYDTNTGSLLHGPDNPVIVGDGASRIFIDPGTDAVYVSCFQDDNVQELNPADGSVLRTFEAGDGAQALAVQYGFRSEVSNSAAVELEVASGMNIDSLHFESYGAAAPSGLSGYDNFTNAVEYFKMEGNVSGFAAVLSISYSDSIINFLGIDENNLIVSYFSENDLRWHSLPTVIDREENKVSVEINHFSYWALTDKTDDIISSVRNDISVPQGFGLEQNYPNPFNPNTVITYRLPNAERVNVTIYNILGQRMRRLVDAVMPAGEHRAAWDGMNAAGRPAAAGIYFYRIQAGKFTGTKKMMLIR